MFPDNQNNSDRENFNQNNNPVTPGFNQTSQQPIQPDPNQFQQPGQPQQFQQPQSPANQPPINQLPPVQASQSQPLVTQPSSFNPLQQMGYQETPAKKKAPNALLLTIIFIILLVIGVVIAMVLISGQSKAPATNLSAPTDGSVTTGQPTDSQDSVNSSAPQTLDTTAVVQDFYDNYLTALRAKSQPKQRLEVLHSYVKNNQDLTPSYQKRLSKVTSINQDPLLFGQKYLPVSISYGDPVAKKSDNKTANLPVTVQSGSKKQILNVTLAWQTAQARAGYWQIAKVTKQ